MGWQDLINSGGVRVLPWLGGNTVSAPNRAWTIQGRHPREYGWYQFNTTAARDCRLVGPAERDIDYMVGLEVLRGFLVGDRFIPNDARVVPDPAKLIDQTEPVFCVDLGLDRFQKAAVVRDREGRLLFMQLEFPEGPETEVLEAYQDRKDSVQDSNPPQRLALFQCASFHLGGTGDGTIWPSLPTLMCSISPPAEDKPSGPSTNPRSIEAAAMTFMGVGAERKTGFRLSRSATIISMSLDC